MKKRTLPVAAALACFATAGSLQPAMAQTPKKTASRTPAAAPFNVAAESFADLQLLRYQVPGFDQLSLQQKQLAYYQHHLLLMKDLPF